MSETTLKRSSGRLKTQTNKRVQKAQDLVGPVGRALKEEIELAIENCESSTSWQGVDDEDEPANLPLHGQWATYRLDASAVVKGLIQTMGSVHGCHTCLCLAARDRRQPWTGDHNPPTNLTTRARDHLGMEDDTYLFPQCRTCSDQQAALVGQIARMRPRDVPAFLDGLTPDRRKLLTGTKAPVASGTNRNCVTTTSAIVSEAQRLEIGTIGANVRNGGCHTCGTSFPCPGYVADHVVPKFLVSEGFRQLFLVLEIELPKLVFRPQCQRCSNSQGGEVAQLARRARDYGRILGIVFDEDPMPRVEL